MKITNIIMIVVALLFSNLAAIAQYTPGTVSNGGTITGTISFEGSVPTMKALKIEKDKKVCAVIFRFRISKKIIHYCSYLNFVGNKIAFAA